jgi:hypothetical protein
MRLTGIATRAISRIVCESAAMVLDGHAVDLRLTVLRRFWSHAQVCFRGAAFRMRLPKPREAVSWGCGKGVRRARIANRLDRAEIAQN